MAITCRVFEAQALAIEAVPGGVRERRRCLFLADAGELDRPDWSEFVVEFLDSDPPGMARTKLVDAAVAEGRRFGYSVSRGRVLFPALDRGN